MVFGLLHAWSRYRGLPNTSWVIGAVFVVGLAGCGKLPGLNLKGKEQAEAFAPGGPIVAEGDADSFNDNEQSLDAGNDQCAHVGRPHNLKVNVLGFTKVTWARAEGAGQCVFSEPEGMESRVTCDTPGEKRLIATATNDVGKLLIGSVTLKVQADGGVGGLDACTGKVSTLLGQVDDSPMAVAVQADGKIIVAGYSQSLADRDFAAVRYNPDGSIDRTFANEGKLVENIAGADVAKAIKIQDDGKIVLAGDSMPGAGIQSFALARYDQNGKPDRTFNLTGKQVTTFPFGPAYGNALLVQPDGKLLVGGEVFNANQQYDFGMVRVNPNGELDAGFGSAGRVIFNAGTNHDGIHAMALQKDGKIVVAGYALLTSNVYNFAISRFNVDGTLDTAFGTNGTALYSVGAGNSTAHAIGIQSDGKIIVVGDYTNGATRDLVIMRLTVAGVIDTAFGVNGITSLGFGMTVEGRQGVVIQGDDKIVVVGSGQVGNASTFVTARLNSNGSLDSSFGQAGITLFDFSEGPDFGRAVALDSKGDIIVTGSTGSPSAFGWFRLFR